MALCGLGWAIGTGDWDGRLWSGPLWSGPLSPGVWNVWPRLAASGSWLASGRRLDVWPSGRLGHV
eukprot:6566030-Prymnesium_polylepis.1